MYRIVGILTFLNVSQHEFKFSRRLVPGDIGIISLRYVTMADHDGLITLISFIETLEKKGIKIILAGVKKKLRKKIESIEGLASKYANRTWGNILKTD